MDRFVVEGGHPLEGTVAVSGAKNAVLPLMAASLLTSEELRIGHAPRLRDVMQMGRVLGALGVKTDHRKDGTLVLDAGGVSSVHAPYEEVRQMRGSFMVLGPLLARFGEARVPHPGGCVIGFRPIDLHLKGLLALGATVTEEHGDIVARAPDGLRGGEMFLGGPMGSTVTGTINVMLAAALAQGETIVEGAACEPEVADVAACLNAMGAGVTGAGTPQLVIEGVESLHGATHAVLPDRIEAGTYLLAGLASPGGRVTVDGCRPGDLVALLDALRQAGAEFEREDSSLTVEGGQDLRATDIATHPYPGFPTDLQAQWLAVMTQADGNSLVEERIYPDRFNYLAELARLGAKIRRSGPRALAMGPVHLSGAHIMASDLRASASLVIAGLVAEGETSIHRVYHIDRGYERIEEKLGAIGGVVARMPDSDPASGEDVLESAVQAEGTAGSVPSRHEVIA